MNLSELLVLPGSGASVGGSTSSLDTLEEAPASNETHALACAAAMDAVLSDANLVACILSAASLRSRAVACAVNSQWAAEAEPLVRTQLADTWSKVYAARWWRRELADEL